MKRRHLLTLAGSAGVAASGLGLLQYQRDLPSDSESAAATRPVDTADSVAQALRRGK